MGKFLADESVDFRIVKALREEHIEVKIKKVKEVLEKFREEVQNRFTVITTNKVRIKDFD